MNGFLINFSLSSSINQQDLIQHLKTDGADVIQTGSGLCVKSSKSADEMKMMLAASKFSDVQLIPVQNIEEQAPDVKSFLSN